MNENKALLLSSRHFKRKLQESLAEYMAISYRLRMNNRILRKLLTDRSNVKNI